MNSQDLRKQWQELEMLNVSINNGLLNQARAAEGHVCLVSWNCFGSCIGMCVCVSVCLSVHLSVCPKDINNQWCDIGHVWLVKQVSWLFPAFNYFIWYLPSIQWMGVAILTQHTVNACQRKLRWHGTSYRRTTRKTEHFIYKSEWANA